MGKFYDAIPQNLVKWIDAQQMFWVASAPLRGDGHVNVSPKGLRGTFHVEHANRVWYEDFTGSGSETMAHLREPGNGRITIMLCAFDGAPRIMRLWGRGTVYEFGTPEYEALLPLETRRPGSRSAVVIDVHKVGTSCGFAVPLYTFKAHRPMLLDFGAKLEENELKSAAGTEEKTGAVGLKAYWVKENLQSLDGLPAMRAAHLSGVMPRHIPANGEWGKGARDGGVDADGSEVASVRKNTNEEMVRLVLAFSMGIAVAAVYVKVSGMA